MQSALTHRTPFSNVEEEPAPDQGSYVLVVDDEPAVREFVDRCLSADGYAVKQAGSALAAIDVMAQHRAALVLCDIRMDGHDGLWLAARLQAEWPSTPIVMITAIDDIATVRQSREIGAIDYLTKPINIEQLRHVVRHAMPREAPPAEPAGDSDAEHSATDAEYTLETPVRCPACGERINHLNAVRLIRSRVHFTSTLPRRGRLLACPHCLAIVPGELTNF